MRHKELQPEQAAAAYTLDRHVSVTAGPGAGKTTVLVGRYLHILSEHKLSSIDQIVAITFTNRAANEMRERLRKELDQRLHHSRGAERLRWMRFKRTLDGAVITTIHGFCMRLLREFPVEAQLDPQFTLLDEHRTSTLLEAAVEESLTEFINRGNEPITRLTAGVSRPRLATALFQMYQTVRGQGLSLDQMLKQVAQSHSAGEDYRALCNELDRLMAELLTARGVTGKAAERKSEAQRRWAALREHLQNEELPLADYCSCIADFREAARPDARGNISSLVKQLDELLWGESREKPFGRLPQMRFDLFSRDYAVALIQLLKQIDRRFVEKKQQLSVLDFDDLQVRTLQLLERPEVIQRASERYKYFLVDEFQDTNGLQLALLDRLALKSRAGANLFIVGDRKQSIYGFRGADVDVFGEMTEAMLLQDGVTLPLLLNFRSQPPLVHFFNFLFARVFTHEAATKDEFSQLGYVEHEPGIAKREARDQAPLVELLIDTLGNEDDPKARLAPRERDAKQLAKRILSLTESRSATSSSQPHDPDASGPQCSDIALLFRAMTNVPVYEAEFRRAGIPYQTVMGKGFYQREEIADLIQLCRFLDNRTDELALAAVLRSPLCGISDNALLALRLAPAIGETPAAAPPQPRRHPRQLFEALTRQREIDFIDKDERIEIERANQFLAQLIERRNRYSIADLLRLAIAESEYATVTAATFDGAQRLANLEKLFTLAEAFERSGAHLIRDFVHYIEDFEALGSRESEGQLDDSANAVKLMTIHQAKGQEFPIVIIPDLHRTSRAWEEFFLLDRHRGLTLKVPDGRGQMVSGSTFTLFSERAKLRDKFEGMRLLYVAATRTRDRLILSGAVKDLAEMARRDSWLRDTWDALELGGRLQSGVIDLDSQTQLQLTVNLIDEQRDTLSENSLTAAGKTLTPDLDQPASHLFPLLRPLAPEPHSAVHRFSVTQLINYRRCPRQYYFDRVHKVPTPEELAVWNDAEAPEPPANLTATLKGAVIHRFCETFSPGDDAVTCLRRSLRDLIRLRQAQFTDRLLDIDEDKAVSDLLPLAENYLSSSVIQRVEDARRISSGAPFAAIPQLGIRNPQFTPGLWSELGFRLRRPLGILTGAIDKLLVTPNSDGAFDIEIIDFKTNRFRSRAVADSTGETPTPSLRPRASRPPTRTDTQRPGQQFSFDFSGSEQIPAVASATSALTPLPLPDEVSLVASDYQLQMQAYALAVRELLSVAAAEKPNIRVTLHFLDPNIEYNLPPELLIPSNCAQAIDEAMNQIVGSQTPEAFPVRPAMHCRMCNFVELCRDGRTWMREKGAS